MGSNEHTTHLFSPTLRTLELAQSSAQRLHCNLPGTHCHALRANHTHCTQIIVSHITFVVSRIAVALHYSFTTGFSSVTAPNTSRATHAKKRNLSECCASEGHAQEAMFEPARAAQVPPKVARTWSRKTSAASLRLLARTRAGVWVQRWIGNFPVAAKRTFDEPLQHNSWNCRCAGTATAAAQNLPCVRSHWTAALAKSESGHVACKQLACGRPGLRRDRDSGQAAEKRARQKNVKIIFNSYRC